MTKYLLPVLFFLSFLSACRKTEAGFEMSYRRQFEIPVGLNPAKSHTYTLLNIPSDTAVFFQINGTTASQVTGVVPRTMSLRPVFQGGGKTFANVYNVEVVIFDPNRPNVPEVPIFYRNEIPANVGDVLTLIPDSNNISKFVLDGKTFNVRIKLYFREVTPSSVEIEANIAFLAKTS
jgi:hypothetical protein